jgi:hypothetical protein
MLMMVLNHTLDHSLREFAHWLSTTTLADFMTGWWEWPIAESLHFIGLSMLIGTVGLFDLRLMGLAKRIPLSALHRLIPFGIAGFVINMLTGICFLTNAANQYMYNPAFHLKILSMAIAGINVTLFYTTMFKKVQTLGPGEDAPLPARIIGGVSLTCWLSVIACGRLLTFYRPPAFHWCFWC